MKKLLLLMLSFVAINANAIEFMKNGFLYRTLSDNTCAIESGYELTGDVTIFYTVSFGGTDYAITEIDEEAFAENTKITSVKINAPVQTIGNNAFDGCTNLTKIVFNESLETIGDYAFRGCSSLTALNIPASLETVGIGITAFCPALASITVAEGNKDFLTGSTYNALIYELNNTLMAGCKNTTVPESVVRILEEAFRGCTGLTKINLPKVKYIREYAFESCSNLTSVSMPVVKTFGKYAFQSCTSLTSITIPYGVEEIPQNFCYNCKNLKSINIPSTVFSPNLVIFGDSSFYKINSKAVVCVHWTSQSDIPFIANEHVLFYNIFGKYGQLSTDMKYMTLIVPLGTSSYYKDTRGWKEFGNIIEMDFPEQTEQTSGLKEDVNDDGQVNSLDALKVYKYMQTH